MRLGLSYKGFAVRAAAIFAVLVVLAGFAVQLSGATRAADEKIGGRLVVNKAQGSTDGTVNVGKLSAGEAITVGGVSLNRAKLAALSTKPVLAVDNENGVLTLTNYDENSGIISYNYNPKENSPGHEINEAITFTIERESFRGTNGIGVQPLNPRWTGDDNLAAVEANYAQLAKMGVKWVRIIADWNRVQPARNGAYDWGYLDDAVAMAEKYDMKVLMKVFGTPNWASEVGNLTEAEQNELAKTTWLNSYAPKPEHDGDFAAFVGAAVQRYGKRGVLDYEIWNEPGNQFWRDTLASPKPNPAHYTNLVKLSYAAAHAAHPNVNVLAGGMTVGVTRADGTYISAREFLEQMYAAGAKGYFDNLSHHPYGIDAKDFVDNGWAQMAGEIVAPSGGEKTLLQIMQEHGDGDKGIWPTEAGEDAMFAGVAEENQAKVVKALLEQHQKSAYAGPLIIYQAQKDSKPYVQGVLNIDVNGDKLVDVNVDTDGDGIPDANIDLDGNMRPDILDAADREAYYGLWKNDGSPKPAVNVISQFSANLRANRVNLNITIRGGEASGARLAAQNSRLSGGAAESSERLAAAGEDWLIVGAAGLLSVVGGATALSRRWRF